MPKVPSQQAGVVYGWGGSVPTSRGSWDAGFFPYEKRPCGAVWRPLVLLAERLGVSPRRGKILLSELGTGSPKGLTGRGGGGLTKRPTKPGHPERKPHVQPDPSTRGHKAGRHRDQKPVDRFSTPAAKGRWRGGPKGRALAAAKGYPLAVTPIPTDLLAVRTNDFRPFFQVTPIRRPEPEDEAQRTDEVVRHRRLVPDKAPSIAVQDWISRVRPLTARRVRPLASTMRSECWERGPKPSSCGAVIQ